MDRLCGDPDDIRALWNSAKRPLFSAKPALIGEKATESKARIAEQDITCEEQIVEKGGSRATMSWKITSVILSVVSLATAVGAQTTANEGLVERRALVLRYMTATHLDERMNSIETVLLPTMLAQSQRQYPNIPDTVRLALNSSANEAMRNFIPKFESRIADIMAAKFSTDELEQVVAFYESPIGQKIIAKSGEMMSSVQPLIQELIPGLEADMRDRLCKKIDCSSLPKPAAT